VDGATATPSFASPPWRKPRPSIKRWISFCMSLAASESRPPGLLASTALFDCRETPRWRSTP
jgi:hypothetical protein